MKIDENFTIKPLDLEDDMSLEGAEMYLKTDKIARKEPNNKDFENGFGFNMKANYSEPKKAPKPSLPAITQKKKSKPTYSYDADPNYQPQTNDDLIVYFFYNDWKVKPNDAAKINKVSDVIKAGSKVKLVGHADNIGTPGNNLKVARLRAEAVRDYLMEEGISVEEKITIISHGERYPVGDNETSKGRGKNRRVEIFVK
jgi:outer membrane protein OmpA-like peptidoglycan-associated protein